MTVQPYVEHVNQSERTSQPGGSGITRRTMMIAIASTIAGLAIAASAVAGPAFAVTYYGPCHS